MRPDTFPKSGTITVTELRSQPGEYLSAVSRCGESFLITKSGRPAAKLVPVGDKTIVERDGTIRGPLPLTFRQQLGG